LKEIQRYFGGEGKIDRAGKDRESFSYTISSRKAITTVVLPHFDLYPLITQKKADYELFKRIIEIMNNQEHLTDLGLQKIINHRASLNLGLSEGLKIAFPNTKPILRPLVVSQEIPSPQWVAGFVSGEGTFYVATSESKTSGLNVRLRFILSQDSRDKELMKSLTTYFGCGVCEVAKDGMAYFSVTKFSDNYGKIMLFFITHQLAGVKVQDFED
jgi:LAGLIDADG endonuclease